MTTAVLLVIYISFIGLGLPDTLLGSAWPAMRVSLAVPLDFAGFISLMISLCTVVSGLLAGRLLAKLGTGRVAFLSVLCTAVGLFGFSCSHSFYTLLIMAVPLGFGAGAVDTGLNSFVATHYKPCHMSFLHCFWGIGAISAPAIMSFWLARGNRWDMGYRTAAAAQAVLVALLALSLPLWHGIEAPASPESPPPLVGNRAALSLNGVKTSLAAFFCYCSLEMTAGLWASSYLTQQHSLSADNAAVCTSLFYVGIAVGRFASGIISAKLPTELTIRAGQCLCAVGCVLLVLPLGVCSSIIGFMLFGLGCSPIYPAMLSQTPRRFGIAAAQAVMGLQTAVAYFGSTVTPTLVGIAVGHIGMAALPWFMLIATVLMFFLCERLNRLPPQKTAHTG